MPLKDRTGPEGKGPGTGRGKGECSDLEKEDSSDPKELAEGDVGSEELGIGRGGKPRHLRRKQRKSGPLSWLERAR